METIRIETGEISLSINGDESRVIRFNPSDQLFAEKFYKALGEIEAKFNEYEKQAEALDADTTKDENDIPANMPERFALLRSVNEYNRALIDNVFGAGTAQIAFGDALNMDMFLQFLDGITPYFRSVRAAKVAQYIQNPNVLKPARGTGRKMRKKK
jgi:hypothetical protein